MKKFPLIVILLTISGLTYWAFTQMDSPSEDIREIGMENDIEDNSEYWKSVTTADQTLVDYQPPHPEHDFYSDGLKTRDGTGKYYQGREIADVMGHPAINWLERPDREQEEAPKKALDLIEN